ncbi:hypothetical protein CANCADRAFT_3135 [Tortispora caseinolytica NRRL Y-17796]|uniref:Uncharacterized protein n=1 Tax=Tortispora caseinolytica NRRL Y-17796 TaxID=767744 RepID=A0A1E4T9S2_9ASCO|nr:hypothetical protein CANCADRAFT_3135 [Tortispora caseinolytica NRRL Y-17796]
MSTITEVKTFLCEPPVETTTVYGRVFAKSSGVVTAFDGTCGTVVATVSGWYCQQCVATTISYIASAVNEQHVWGYYEEIGTSVVVRDGVRIEVPVVTVVPVAPTSTEGALSVCASRPPYSEGVYAAGYNTFDESFEAIAAGKYRAGRKVALTAEVTGDGISVEGYAGLVEVMFYMEDGAIRSVSGGSAVVFLGEGGMRCRDIGVIGTGGTVYGEMVNRAVSGWTPVRVVVVTSGRKRQDSRVAVGLDGVSLVLGVSAGEDRNSSVSSTVSVTSVVSSSSAVIVTSVVSSSVSSSASASASASASSSVSASSSASSSAVVSSSTRSNGSASSSISLSGWSSVESSSWVSSSSSCGVVSEACQCEPSQRPLGRVWDVDLRRYSETQVANGEYRVGDGRDISVYRLHTLIYVSPPPGAVTEVLMYVKGPNELVNVVSTGGMVDIGYVYGGEGGMMCGNMTGIGSGGWGNEEHRFIVWRLNEGLKTGWTPLRFVLYSEYSVPVDIVFSRPI